MKRNVLALALSMSCLAVAATACSPPKKIVEAIKPPPERLACVGVPARPTIPSEYTIDWSRVTTVAQAHSEHDAYVRSIRTREGIVAGYVVEVEGRLFVCSNNAAWLREFFGELPG